MLKPEDMPITNEQYAQLKRNERKKKEIKQQLKNNQKANRGFGYNYKEINYEV